MAPEFLSVLSDRIAMRLNSLSLQKKFSIRCRYLYISRSSGSSVEHREMLGNDDYCAPFTQFSDNGVAVKCLVGEEGNEYEVVNKRWHFHSAEELVRALDGNARDCPGYTSAHELSSSCRFSSGLWPDSAPSFFVPWSCQ